MFCVCQPFVFMEFALLFFSMETTAFCIICCQSEFLQREIEDLQSEFEFDRVDYLDTIRKQEQEMQWLQAVIDRLLPVIRRDCNYVNLDKIRAQSTFDENSETWNLPKLTIEKTQLPPAGNHSIAGGDYTVSQKTRHLIFDHNLGKHTTIFKVLSLSHSQGNIVCTRSIMKRLIVIVGVNIW